MSRFHATYDFLWSVVPKDCQIVSMELVGNCKYKNPLLIYCLIFVDYFLLSLKIFTSRHQAVFVREYNNFFYCAFIALAKISKKRLYLNVNHNFKSETAFLEKRKQLKLHNIHLVVCEYNSDTQDMELFFPIQSQVDLQAKIKNKRKKKQQKIILGVVGAYRKEKNFEEIIKYITNHYDRGSLGFENCRFVLGSDFDCRTENQKLLFEFVDTSQHLSYVQLLDSLDIAVINYDSSYRFRSSGVLSDIVSRGVFCLVPNLPILVSQITWPGKAGNYFDCLSQIPELILDSLSYVRSSQRIKDYESFCEGRTDNRLRPIIEVWCK